MLSMSSMNPRHYCHTPYERERSTFLTFRSLNNSDAPLAPLPAETVHACLHGFVSFIPYPVTHDEAQEALTAVASYNLTAEPIRAFIGQLPFHVTAAQLSWICAVFGGKVDNPQRIMKNNGRGQRLPTGGVHVECDDETLDRLMQCMHKRVLIDDTGVWFAATLKEKMALDSYVAFLHMNKEQRRAGRPYETVVVQRAQSSFVPRHAPTFDM